MFIKDLVSGSLFHCHTRLYQRVPNYISFRVSLVTVRNSD